MDARRSNAGAARVEVVTSDRGITIGVGDGRPGDRATSMQRDDVRVDLVVRVPAGVCFAASLIDGDITVEKLRSSVSVATINGSVRIQTAGFAAQANTITGDVVLELPAGANAEFHGTAANGTIDADVRLMRHRGGTPMLPTPGPFLPGPRTEAVVPPPQIVGASLGTGGPMLRATTVHGDIRLRRR